MIARAARWLLPIIVTGIAACGGSSVGDDRRTAFVEVTSSPSGLPVEIRLNNTTLKATTPVAQSVRYDAVCVEAVTSLPGRCTVVGLATVGDSSRVTLCLADGGKRMCESATGVVAVGLEFGT
jgi:hypothetical protein